MSLRDVMDEALEMDRLRDSARALGFSDDEVAWIEATARSVDIGRVESMRLHVELAHHYPPRQPRLMTEQAALLSVYCRRLGDDLLIAAVAVLGRVVGLFDRRDRNE